MPRTFVASITAAAIVLAVFIGCIPVLNQHLHWNIWIFIPVSGMLFGAAFAWLQFMCAKFARKPLQMRTIWILAAGTAVAYFSTEIGRYYSLVVPLYGSDVLSDGDYPIHQLVSFAEFVTLSLSASTIRSFHFGEINLGGAGTAVSSVIDLIGAGLGALVTFSSLVASTPFCLRCSRYMRIIRTFDIHLSPESVAESIQTRVLELSRQSRLMELEELLRGLSDVPSEHCRSKISVNECICNGCNTKALTGKFLRVERNDWLDVAGGAFSTARQS